MPYQNNTFSSHTVGIVTLNWSYHRNDRIKDGEHETKVGQTCVKFHGISCCCIIGLGMWDHGLVNVVA